MNDQRSSTLEWVWQDGARNYAVRVFPSTRRLIWSSSVDTPEGPVFDQGVAQTYAQFLRGDPPPHMPPSVILDDLRAQIIHEDKKQRGGLFGWLRR